MKVIRRRRSWAPKARRRSRLAWGVGGLWALGLLTAMSAGAGSVTSSAGRGLNVSAWVAGRTAVIRYAVDLRPGAIVSRDCSLDGNPVRCGAADSSTRSKPTFRAPLSNLAAGRHAFVVAVTLRDGSIRRRATAFEIAPCNVQSRRARAFYDGTGENLQAAIDDAPRGDTLRVQGLCKGSFIVDRSLTLVGADGRGDAAPTLDAGRRDRVLTIIGAGTVVVIDNLVITNGVARGFPDDNGGGIYNEGRLTLARTSVTANTGTLGGGIANVRGSVTISAASTISGNTAKSNGGGIANTHGSVTINGASRIDGNTAIGLGGGIANDHGTVMLGSESRISGNTAIGRAAPRPTIGPLVPLDYSPSSDGPVVAGGGIYNDLGTVIGFVAGVNVFGNTPDQVSP